MSLSDVQTLILGLVTTYGGYVLAILGGVVVLSLAYLGFRFGWRKLRGAVK